MTTRHSAAFDNKIWLAPLAGATDLAYRKICKSFGADVSVTEMISAKALSFNDKKSFNMLKCTNEGGFKGVQIFGSDPVVMGRICKTILDGTAYDFIDINMGCPAPKIVKNGEGSALMRDEALAMRIVDAVKRNTDKPVSVKMRSGFSDDAVNGLQFAVALERAGADAVVVHGRTRQQMYSGAADWQLIGEIAHKLTIPVIGNGDIKTPQEAKLRLSQFGCQGIMIGRAAQGRPWLFKQVRAYLDGKTPAPEPDYTERIAIIKRHIELMRANKADFIIALEMRKHVAWYLKGLAGTNEIKAAVNRATSSEQIIALLEAAKT